LNLLRGNPRQLAQMVLSGEADMAIATESLAEYPEFVTVPCYQWHHCVVVKKGHALAKLKPLTLEAIATYPIVTYDSTFPAPPPPCLEGHLVIFPTLNELTAVPPGSLNGKIAMVAQRMVRAQDGAGYGAAVPGRTEGPKEAAQRGAIAFLLRSVGTDSHRLAHAGTTRYFDGRVPVPAFALSPPDADQIERIAALGQTVRVRLISGASYRSDAHSQNVIA
jgi:DNA-binding transcriptional LysR family regulator